MITYIAIGAAFGVATFLQSVDADVPATLLLLLVLLMGATWPLLAGFMIDEYLRREAREK